MNTNNASFSSPLNYFNSWGAETSFANLIELLDSSSEMKKKIYRWNKQKALYFMESVLLGIPIPSMYIALKDNQKYIVDGYHRIKTIADFLSGVFQYDGSEFRVENNHLLNETWNNKTYSELSEIDKNRIKLKTVHIIVIDLHDSSILSMEELSKRINT